MLAKLPFRQDANLRGHLVGLASEIGLASILQSAASPFLDAFGESTLITPWFSKAEPPEHHSQVSQFFAGQKRGYDWQSLRR